ncbi:hypothetical protein BDR03DRAFT_926434, partial [Suillus americanus]
QPVLCFCASILSLPVSPILTSLNDRSLSTDHISSTDLQDQVRGSRRKRVQALVFNGEQISRLHHEDDNELQVIRYDAFERSYSIRWLTALIAQLE